MSADTPDRLDLARIELRKAQRAVRFAVQLVAQEIDSKAADTNDSPKEDTRDRDSSTSIRE
jgi:hypothetical protein